MPQQFTPKVNNINTLDKSRFLFSVDKLPNTNYFIQTCNAPGVSMNQIKIPTPFSSYPVEGDKISYEEFTIGFKVDEDLSNWIEIYNWIVGLVRVDDFQARQKLEASSSITGKKGLYSNALLLILDSNYQPHLKFSFIDIFPVSLQEIQFSSTLNANERQDCTVSFAYRNFYVEKI